MDEFGINLRSIEKYGGVKVNMEKQEILMSEHEIVMPGETVVHPQAVHIEEEEVVMERTPLFEELCRRK